MGRWTVEFLLSRGPGRTLASPDDDVGPRDHLQRWLGLSERLGGIYGTGTFSYVIAAFALKWNYARLKRRGLC